MLPVNGRVDLAGAADLHCHFGPDAHRERSVDAPGAVRDALAAGHSAIVLKSHDTPTAQLARILDAANPGIRVFGGVCCDREIGGLNPYAVETALRLGAKIVWLPTLSSQQDVDNGIAARLGLPPVGLRILDDAGALRPECREVLDLVARHGAILATGHVSRDEHFAVAREFRGRLLVTHAREELAGPNLSLPDCIELARMGASLELCALTCIGALATRPVSDFVELARAVGVERCTLGSDFGQKINVAPAPGLQQFADALAEAGMSHADVRRMACGNPRELLGI